MGRNAVSGCSLFSQEWSWQMLVVIFPLSYWHSSVMFSGAFLCCCFYRLTKTAICLCSVHFSLLSTVLHPLYYPGEPGLCSCPGNQTQRSTIRSGGDFSGFDAPIPLWLYSCQPEGWHFPLTVTRQDICALPTTQAPSPAVPRGFCRSRCGSTWKTTSAISTATWILHFLFSIVTQGSVSTRAGKHFSGKEAALCPWSIVCKAHREIPWATHALLILVVPLKRTD